MMTGCGQLGQYATSSPLSDSGIYIIPDPTTGSPRIKSTLRVLALRRWEPAQIQMYVTIEVLEHAYDNLEKVDKVCPLDYLVLMDALATAWFFLLRSSEYCRIDGELKLYCLRIWVRPISRRFRGLSPPLRRARRRVHDNRHQRLENRPSP